MRGKASKLTKKDLEKYIESIEQVDGEWIITTKSGKIRKPTLYIKHHKYGNDISYYIITFYDKKNKKYITHTLQRILYAWFIGNIPQGKQVDHINSDTLDNRLENLQLLTQTQNLYKRGSWHNQYTNNKKK